ATSWTVVPSPNSTAGYNYLQAVSATSSGYVWAVGFACPGSCAGSNAQSLIEHWDGSAWGIVSSPNVNVNTYLYGVSALSASDAWVAGYANSCYGCAPSTLSLHWNGTTWSVIPSPNGGSSSNMLEGITAISTNDVWAVGTYQNGSVAQTLTLHWNGTAWSVVSSADAGTSYNRLAGVRVAPSTGDVWAVGYDQTGSGPYQTLVERYSDPCAPTATPTNTPGGPTDTPTATNTPSSTPTRTPTITPSSP